MAFKAAAGEQYTIRRKVLKLFGAGFHLYDAQGKVVGYCKQKAFRLREDLRICTNESCTEELLRVTTKSVLDISGTYDVVDAAGQRVGSLTRAGIKSSFLRDEWTIRDAAGEVVGTLREDSTWKALVRRYVNDVAFLLPQKFHLTDPAGRELATFRQHFNIFVYRLGIAIKNPGGPDVNDGPDELLILAAGCVVAAIEGRQS